MSKSSKQAIMFAIVVIAGAILYFGSVPSEDGNRAESLSESTTTATGQSDSSPRTFAGYECTEDCSGHEAGYAWAEKNDISDGDDCDSAGEHSNSPSFAEGCHAYVDGDADSEGSGDSDDDN